MVLQVTCVFKAVGRKQKTKKHMRGYMALLPPPVPPCGGPRSGGSGPEVAG